jgi:hypothetical protein
MAAGDRVGEASGDADLGAHDGRIREQRHAGSIDQRVVA